MDNWQPLLETMSKSGGGRIVEDVQTRTLSRSSSTNGEERELLHRRQEQPGWTVDRGTGHYAEQRERHKRAFLVETGRHAGRSRVKLEGVDWQRLYHHIVKRDFFNAAVNARLVQILTALFIIYFVTLLSWGFTYYVTWRLSPQCFTGFTGLSSAVLFSIETQQTIGYGSRAPGDCWISALLVGIHSVISVIIDSVIIGIVFARISHPKYRGRTILMSDCAVIARRDGCLKFMLRVGDIKRSHIVAPSLKAVLYTWGTGRTTCEGEHLPVKRQLLKFEPWDVTLLLPEIVEHIIDERSPLFGLTAKSLEALNAEIVVQLEGCTELGDMFMVRRSYLPQEIYWGHVFCPTTRPAAEGETTYSVDISRFHDVEPQACLDMHMMPIHKLSTQVVLSCPRSLPGQVLTESSLVLCDDLVVCPRNGQLFLMIRLGDRCPGQVLEVHVRAYVYRWTPTMTQEGEVLPYEVEELDLSPAKPILRYPVTVLHEISCCSPLANWSKVEGKRQDADAEIVVIVKGTLYATNEPTVLTRAYPVLNSVKWGQVHAPIVSSDVSGRVTGKVVVDWSNFHTTMPLTPGAPGLTLVPSKKQIYKSADGGVRGHSAPQDGSPMFSMKSAAPFNPSSGAALKVSFQNEGGTSSTSAAHDADSSPPPTLLDRFGSSAPSGPVLQQGESWKRTRSLFAALDEMRSLMDAADDEGKEEGDGE